jgi:hypothetical protein
MQGEPALAAAVRAGGDLLVPGERSALSRYSAPLSANGVSEMTHTPRADPLNQHRDLPVRPTQAKENADKGSKWEKDG